MVFKIHEKEKETDVFGCLRRLRVTSITRAHLLTTLLAGALAKNCEALTYIKKRQWMVFLH